MEALADLLREGASGTASGSARDRLEEMAEFYEVTREAMESALRSWRERRRT